MWSFLSVAQGIRYAIEIIESIGMLEQIYYWSFIYDVTQIIGHLTTPIVTIYNEIVLSSQNP